MSDRGLSSTPPRDDELKPFGQGAITAAELESFDSPLNLVQHDDGDDLVMLDMTQVESVRAVRYEGEIEVLDD